MRSEKTRRHRVSVPRISADQFLGTMEDANRASVNFLKIDLETGLLFSRMALQTNESEKKHRNTLAARRAYDTIVRLRANVHPTPADSDFLTRNLGLLKCDLRLLGESV